MAYEHCPLSLAPPNRVAIAPALTYGQLNTLVQRGAAALLALGFKPGDQVPFPAAARRQTIALLFATWRIGCVAVLDNQAAPLDPFEGHDLFSETTLDMQRNALRLRTSGTSGTPKWASFTLSQLFESARTVSAALRAEKGNQWLISIPLAHVAGLGVALRGLLTEGTLHFEDKSLPYRDRIYSVHPDFASLVPTQLYRLLRDETPPLKTYLLIGGAPLAEELYRKAISRGMRLSLTYGLTEMSSTVLLTEKPKWIGVHAYLGEPLPGRSVSLSENGEILVAGNSLFNGYGTPPPSPFPTGDLGAFHPEFGWSIQGRKDFQFQSGGENIQPEEIEAALLSHPEVEEAVVVPKPDKEFGARPAAFVRTRLTAADLTAYLSGLLPKSKIPVLFHPLEEGIGLKPNRKELANKMH